MTARAVTAAVLVICSSAFVALTVVVAGHLDPLPVDRAALSFVEGIQTPGLTGLMRVVTAFGSTPGVVAILTTVGFAILFVRSDPVPMGWLVAASTGALLIYNPLKAILDRPRPTDGLAAASGASFPSGHASQGVAFFGMLAVVALGALSGWPRVVAATVAVVVGVLSGLSRVYLEVHWLTDVVGGFLLGAAWLSALLLLRDTVRRRSRQPAR